MAAHLTTRAVHFSHLSALAACGPKRSSSVTPPALSSPKTFFKMSVNKKPASGVDNTARRTWDKEEFRQKAKEREEREAKASRTLHVVPPEGASRGALGGGAPTWGAATPPLHGGAHAGRCAATHASSRCL